MAYIFSNFVRTVLSSGVTAGATTISVVAATPPNVTPPDPGTGTAVLVLSDSLEVATKRNVISYTGRTDNGDGTYTLTGVSGVSQSWTAGAHVVLDVMSEQLSAFETHRTDGFGDPHPQYQLEGAMGMVSQKIYVAAGATSVPFSELISGSGSLFFLHSNVGVVYFSMWYGGSVTYTQHIVSGNQVSWGNGVDPVVADRLCLWQAGGYVNVSNRTASLHTLTLVRFRPI